MRRLALGFFFLFGAMAMGCGSDPGSIAVRWSVGLNSDCDTAGIASVRITLEEEDGATIGPVTAPCGEGRTDPGFVIDDVEEGSYAITLEGLDAAGTVIYLGRSSSRVNVSEGSTASAPSIVLSPAPAQLTIQWAFDNGLGCAVQDGAPEDVEVLVFKSDTALPGMPQTTACADSQLVISDLAADPDYDVRVRAQSGSGDPLFQFEELDIELADGEQRTVTGTFIPCAEVEGGCN